MKGEKGAVRLLPVFEVAPTAATNELVDDLTADLPLVCFPFFS